MFESHALPGVFAYFYPAPFTLQCFSLSLMYMTDFRNVSGNWLSYIFYTEPEEKNFILNQFWALSLCSPGETFVQRLIIFSVDNFLH